MEKRRHSCLYLYTVVIIILFATASFSNINPRMKPLLHYGISMEMSFTSAVLLSTKLDNRKPIEIYTYSTVLALIPGIGKEFHDLQKGGEFSGEDIVMDLLGAVSGVMFYHLTIGRQLKLAIKADTKGLQTLVTSEF